MIEPTESQVTTADDVTIALYAYGGTGAPILLGHPTGFNGRVWDPVAAALVAAGRSVWTYDHRGHGHSTLGPSPDWSGYALDVLAVLDHLALDPAAVVGAGLSMGGAAWLLAAAQRPALARALWLYEPIVFPPEIRLPPGAEVPLAPIARRRRNRWASPAAAIESYGARPPMNAFHPDALAGYVASGLTPSPDGVWQLSCDPDTEADAYNHGINSRAWDPLPRLATPTVIVVGTDSDAIDRAWAQRLVDRLPHGCLSVWEGAGHFGPFVAVDRAAAEIAAL